MKAKTCQVVQKRRFSSCCTSGNLPLGGTAVGFMTWLDQRGCQMVDRRFCVGPTAAAEAKWAIYRSSRALTLCNKGRQRKEGGLCSRFAGTTKATRTMEAGGTREIKRDVLGVLRAPPARRSAITPFGGLQFTVMRAETRLSADGKANTQFQQRIHAKDGHSHAATAI
jgi:hypothetical protein